MPRAIAALVNTLVGLTVSNHSDPFSASVPFDIRQVAHQAESLPANSWEHGTAIQVLLELYNPEMSVFGNFPFSAKINDTSEVNALTYAEQSIVIGTGNDCLSKGDGSVGDPASLGVGAYLLGKADERYEKAASEQLDYVLGTAPRWENGAISHRVDVPELWADFMYMAPPFIAYVGADTKNNTLLEEGYNQCKVYREVLSSRHEGSNLWKHIVGPQSGDPGHWSTGNGWAAGGMTRVLATIMKAPAASPEFRAAATQDLTDWIKEIVDAVIEADTDNGLVRNYVDDTSSPHGFGEFAGMSMVASVIYRMTVLAPDAFSDEKYLKWADNVLVALGGNHQDGSPYINDRGIIIPAVNPYAWHDTQPYTAGSPEAQGMATLAYAAFRDCVNVGKCTGTLESSEPTWNEKQDRRSIRMVRHRRSKAHKRPVA